MCKYRATIAGTRLRTLAGMVLTALSMAVPAGNAQTLTTLYSFKGTSAGDGAAPQGIVLASSGTLYGATFAGGNAGLSQGLGTVFQLAPPSSPGAPPVESVLHKFAGWDGNSPKSGVFIGPSGALYGTTEAGGQAGKGTVFELNPPTTPGGSWSEIIVYNFTGKNGDGATPCSGVVMSATGTLYGTTLSGGTAGLGTVYELTPPGVAGGAWSETVIHSFTNQNGDGAGPFAGLAGGSAGALYGTTYSGGASKFGTVFRLAPPAEPDGRWTETILYSFTAQNGDGATPYAPVAIGANGKLYGTTYAGGASGLGTIYEVAPPATSGGPWTESVLYSFSGEDGDGSNPYAGAVISNNGTLYGTTQFGGNRGLGSLFELAPPSVTGAGWIKVLLHTFSGGVDGKYPVTGLVIGASGGLYGATTGGGAKGHGTVFDLKP